MELGKRLRDERLRRKLSLRDAAAKIGISHTYLSAVEKGYDPRSGAAVMPSQEVLLKVCRAYGLDASEVVPTVDLRREEEFLLFAARQIRRLRSTDPARYAHLLDIIAGNSD